MQTLSRWPLIPMMTASTTDCAGSPGILNPRSVSTEKVCSVAPTFQTAHRLRSGRGTCNVGLVTTTMKSRPLLHFGWTLTERGRPRFWLALAVGSGPLMGIRERQLTSILLGQHPSACLVVCGRPQPSVTLTATATSMCFMATRWFPTKAPTLHRPWITGDFRSIQPKPTRAIRSPSPDSLPTSAQEKPTKILTQPSS